LSTPTVTGATDYDKEQDARIKKLEDKVFGTVPEPCPPGFHKDLVTGKCVPDGPEPNCGPNPDPTDSHLKPGGWGGDTAGAATWDAVPMKDDPALWKIVDKAGVNVAHKFASEAEAEAYIKYHRCIQEGGDPDPDPEPPCPPGQHKDAAGNCVPDDQPPGPGTTGATPYPPKGNPMQSTQRGPTTRHYASGKPDDETIEKNVKGIPYKNYQFVTYTTMHKIEHDDNLSVKFGGHHMGKKGWYDCGISFEGQTCLGVEPKHPSTKLCVVKGPKLGSVIEKKTGVAGVYFTDQNKIELWIDEGGAGSWKKVAEGVGIAGLKPTPGNQECQLRIDGFEKGSIPTIHSAIVTEI
jgi:hypothetical protein